MVSQSCVEKLQADDCSRRAVVFMRHENGMRRCHERPSLFIRVKRHGKHKTVWLDCVLMNSTLVPNFVHSAAIPGAEMSTKNFCLRFGFSSYGTEVSGGLLP